MFPKFKMVLATKIGGNEPINKQEHNILIGLLSTQLLSTHDRDVSAHRNIYARYVPIN